MNNRITVRTVYALLPVTPGEANKNRLLAWDAYPQAAGRDPELFLLWLETAHPLRRCGCRCATANKDLVYDQPHIVCRGSAVSLGFHSIPDPSHTRGK
jgi:hypothetical protein